MGAFRGMECPLCLSIYMTYFMTHIHKPGPLLFPRNIPWKVLSHMTIYLMSDPPNPVLRKNVITCRVERRIDIVWRGRPHDWAAIEVTKCTNTSYHCAAPVDPSPPDLLIFLSLYHKIYLQRSTWTSLWFLRTHKASSVSIPSCSHLGRISLLIRYLESKL